MIEWEDIDALVLGDPAELEALERAAFGDHVCIPLGSHGGHVRVARDAPPDVLAALARMMDAAWEQAERDGQGT